MALDIPALSLANLPAQAAPQPSSRPGPAGAPAAATPTRWIVPDTPLPFGALTAIEGEGSLAIGELTLRDGQRVYALLSAHLKPSVAAKIAAELSGAPRKSLYGGEP